MNQEDINDLLHKPYPQNIELLEHTIERLKIKIEYHESAVKFLKEELAKYESVTPETKDTYDDDDDFPW